METASSLGLPVGCHFEPSDKELLLHFLNNKKKTEKGSWVERTSSGGCVIWKSQNDKPVKAKLDPRESTETRIGFKRMFSYVPKEGSTSKAKGDWPRLIRGNVNQGMQSSIVSEPYHEEQNDDGEVDVGSEILKPLDQD
ncbi:hypothetical protein FF1_025448 [Malus domestica]